MSKHMRIFAAFMILTIVLSLGTLSGGIVAEAPDNLKGIQLDNKTITNSTNDLVYRDYEKDAMEVDTNSFLIVQNLSHILEGYQVEGIYAYQYEKNSLYLISKAVYDVKYKIPEEGHYKIYALLQDGNRINLGEYATIEQSYSIKEHSSITQSQEGFIYLN